MAMYHWSQTAASNASADPTINWAEGQAPSTVNDSDRAMMAATAKWRDDISGSITTAGTATAYTVTSNSVFDSLAHLAGQLISFIPHVTNTGNSLGGTPTTLAVDGLTAKPIRLIPGVDLEPFVLIKGTVYLCSYNNVDGVFYLLNARANTGKFVADPGGVNQAVSGNTNIKVVLANRTIDPDVLFDNVTNYRYTPVTPGFYYFMFQVTMNGQDCYAQIYRNGTAFSLGTTVTGVGSTNIVSVAQCLVLTTNGTDFFEGWAHTGGTTNLIQGSGTETFFFGWRLL